MMVLSFIVPRTNYYCNFCINDVVGHWFVCHSPCLWHQLPDDPLFSSPPIENDSLFYYTSLLSPSVISLCRLAVVFSYLYLFCSYLIASHTTDYQHPMLFFNTIAVFVLVVAKFPNMHKVRIFGINADQWTLVQLKSYHRKKEKEK